MKVEILQENISKALGNVLKFVDQKAALPILGSVLMEAKGGNLVLVATNMETGVEIKLPAKVITEGRVAIPARTISEYVNFLPQGKVEIGEEEEGLTIKTGNQKAKLIKSNVEEFPDIPKFDKSQKIEIKSSDLSRLVRLVAFSAAHDNTRPVLTAICMDFSDKGNLSVAATDGYRLSVMEKIKVEGEGMNKRLLLPVMIIREVEKMVRENGNETVEMSVASAEQSVAFKFGKVLVVSRLIEGEFPDYKKIVPNNNTVQVKFSREEITSAVKVASIFARESANIIKWEIEGGKIKVAANSKSVGEQQSVVEVEKVEGTEGKIAFNSKFLLEFLGSGEGQVVFSMSEELRPGLFTSDEKGFAHVIMPVRVAG